MPETGIETWCAQMADFSLAEVNDILENSIRLNKKGKLGILDYGRP